MISIKKILIVLLVCGLFSKASNAQKASENQLFKYSITSSKLTGKPSLSANNAIHLIDVDRKISALEVGDSFSFPLPDGQLLDISIATKSMSSNGDTQLKGVFGPRSNGSLLITFGQNTVYATLTNPQYNFTISIDENRNAVLVDNSLYDLEINLGDDMMYAPDFKPMRHLQDEPVLLPKADVVNNNSSKSEVTIMIIYSQEFANGFADPLTRINQMIAFSNDAYVRSGINIELKLAHARQINFSNSTNVGTLLNQVTASTGSFNNVANLRDQYYADLVAVLPFKSSGGISGIAWVNGGNQRYAYSVSQFARFGSDSLFAHEIGHNLGSGHERLSANPAQGDPCVGGYTGYACGHGNGSEGTIMSYLNDRAWGYVFSNPSLDCEGEPCGISDGSANAADNRTSFNITGPLNERFRIDTSNDDDKDGIKNDVDNCPDVVNPSQINSDDDSQGDACDLDDDNDTINDVIDNCPFEPNLNQVDSNGNGIGDVCEDNELCLPVMSTANRVSVICL